MSDGSWPALAGRPLTLSTVDGVLLHAEEHGPPDGPTVVMVHGYQLSQRLWARQVLALRLHRPDVRVVTYDHRGHGRSGRTAPERATLQQLGADLHAVLELTAPDGPVVLVGHSMGGMTIMSFAEQYPDVVRSQVQAVALLSTSGAGLGDNDFGAHPRVAALARRVVPLLQTWVHRRVERGHRKPPSPATRRLLFGTAADRYDVRRTQQVLDATPAATSAHFWATFDDHDRLHALEQLSAVPVLVACGDRDRITPIVHTHALAEAIPHAEVVCYPGAGHMLMLERSEDLNGRLCRLLSALPTAALRAG